MSYQAVTAVLNYSKAKGSDRLVLLVIASHINKDTLDCHPGRDLLSRESAMSERNLIYCLKRLEQMGELIINRGSGRGRLTTYQINLGDSERVQPTASFAAPERVQNPVESLQQPSPFEPERVQAAASFEGEKGCNPASERVQNPAERVQSSVRKGAKSSSACKDIEPKGTIKETEEEPKEEPGAPAPMSDVFSGQIREVFAYWQYRLNHRQAKLTTERKEKIRARLKEGYTVEQIKQAIDGCANSPFHQGQNERDTVYDDLTLICRTGSKLESFIAKASGNSLAAFSPAARQTIAAAESWLKHSQEKGEL